MLLQCFQNGTACFDVRVFPRKNTCDFYSKNSITKSYTQCNGTLSVQTASARELVFCKLFFHVTVRPEPPSWLLLPPFGFKLPLLIRVILVHGEVTPAPKGIPVERCRRARVPINPDGPLG